MRNLAFDRHDADLDLLICSLERWEEVTLEINNSIKAISDYPVDLTQLKQELLAIQQLNNSDRHLSLVSYQEKVNYLVAELARLKVNSSQFRSSLTKIIALQERLEVLQVKQTITSSPNYHYELSQVVNGTNDLNQKYSLREKILLFKLKYPENFWAGIVAIFSILIFSLQVTATSESFFPSSDRSDTIVEPEQ